MFRSIAVALDESPESGRALAKAIELAKILGVSLRTVTVAEELPAYTAFASAADPSAVETLKQDQSDFYGSLQRRAIEAGRAEGVEILPSLLDGDRIESIHVFVKNHNVDLLVIGLHKRSLRMSSLWSTVYTLAQELPCHMLGIH
jgi:nucleotide-binding universal stress UspA family protein